MTGIRRTENLLQNGVSVVTSPGVTHHNVATYVASVAAVDQTVATYQNIAAALIAFPRGYVLTSGLNPIHHESASLGGRRPVPSLAGHPAGGPTRI